jgi:CDP-glycerol glycerophosphotransferase
MIKRVLIYSRHLLNLPLYYLMFIMPPKKNLWIFGSWFGEKYFDNPKFLFEYVKQVNNDIQVVWITKNKSICNKVDIVYKYSFKGLYFSFFGEIYIVSHSTLVDVFPFVNNKVKKVIQLWHGIPIKKIGYDDKLHMYNSFKNNIQLIIFPFLQDKFSLVIASSKSDQINMASAFNIDVSHVKITGYPRNDIFARKLKTQERRYKILYGPTLRNNINSEINLFDDFGFDKEKIINFLEGNKIYLDIKMHPANQIDRKFKDSIQSKYINFLESKSEINDILKDYSLVISDYSGLYVDFLLTNKPIIFAPFDYEKYIAKDRELYYDYNQVTPGPKCKDWNEVIEWIAKFKNDSTLYKSERTKIRNRFHKYQDSRNCERVYNEIIKLGSSKSFNTLKK